MTNARKSREKHRMEEKVIENEQFEQERIKAMAEAYEVFTCSGIQVHTPNCEGCEIIKLDDLEIEIIKEHRKWEELGMTPLGSLQQLPMMPGVPIDIFKTSMALAALSKIVVEKLGVDKDELDHEYQQLYLDKLRTIREANQDEIIAAKRRQDIAVPGSQVMPQLIVPENIRRKNMH